MVYFCWAWSVKVLVSNNSEQNTLKIKFFIKKGWFGQFLVTAKAKIL